MSAPGGDRIEGRADSSQTEIPVLKVSLKELPPGFMRTLTYELPPERSGSAPIAIKIQLESEHMDPFEERRRLLKRLQAIDHGEEAERGKALKTSTPAEPEGVIGVGSSPETGLAAAEESKAPPGEAAAAGSTGSGTVEVTVAGMTHLLDGGEVPKSQLPGPHEGAEPGAAELSQEEPPLTQPASFDEVLRNLGIDPGEAGILDVSDSLSY